MGRLEVRVCGARLLGTADDHVDAYVKVSLVHNSNVKLGHTYKTSVVRDRVSPTWSQALFKFTVADDDSTQVLFEVWQRNVFVDDLIGSYRLSLNGLVRGVVEDAWVVLRGTRRTSAELHVRVLAVDFGRDAPPGTLAVTSLEQDENNDNNKNNKGKATTMGADASKATMTAVAAAAVAATTTPPQPSPPPPSALHYAPVATIYQPYNATAWPALAAATTTLPPQPPPQPLMQPMYATPTPAAAAYAPSLPPPPIMPYTQQPPPSSLYAPSTTAYSYPYAYAAPSLQQQQQQTTYASPHVQVAYGVPPDM